MGCYNKDTHLQHKKLEVLKLININCETNVKDMEITLEQLYKGKSTKINEKDFLATKDYTENFVNKMKSLTSNFRIEVVMPKQMTITSNETDITYNKVLIQAILPKQIDGYNEIVALSYSLDTRTPVYKLYRAYYNNTTGVTMCFDSN